MAVLSLSASTHRGPAFDEVAHVTAGASYIAHRDYRYQPENGLLPQTLVGAPLSMDAGIDPPAASGLAWRRGDVWSAGRSYLFDQLRPWSSMMLRARAMILGLALLLAFAVWRFSRALWGPAGGLLSLALCALWPDLLAHGAMATSDLAAALFFLLSTAGLWALLGRPGPQKAALAGLALAGLALSKASAVLMAPVGLGMLLWRARRGTLGHAGPVFWATAAALVVLVAGVWGGYGGRFEAFAPDGPGTESIDSAQFARFNKPLEPMLDRTGALEPALRTLIERRLLPEAWLYGFTFVLAHSEARPAFLRGEHRSDGWWWFFPYVFLVKTPLPLLALLLLGGVAAARRKPAELAPFVVLFLVYWAFSLTSNLNIGSRHLLPTLPPLAIAAGAAGRWLERPGAPRLALLALLAALLLDVGLAYPRYLSYFNPLDGGPKQAWSKVVDSSLDWGQDGPALAEQLDRLRGEGEPVWLAWFGSTDPQRYGIEARALPSFMAWAPAGDPPPLTPGLFAISATQLQGVYLPQPGPWTAEQEAAFQGGHAQWRTWLLSGGDAPARARLLRQADEGAWREALATYERLRFQRLCAWLRLHAHPVGRAGNSVLIYRLSDADLAAALGGPPP